MTSITAWPLPNVALTGLARSGKDTVGRILVDQYGYRRVSFADGVRQVALAIDPMVGGGRLPLSTTRLSTLVEDVGWDEAKSYTEVRRLLQVIGTEAGREIFGHDVWVDLALKAVEAETRPLAFTDVRFANEAAAARKRGQIDGRGTALIRMVRSVGNETLTNGRGGHASETGVATLLVDHEVSNDGTIGDLEETLYKILSTYVPGGARVR